MFQLDLGEDDGQLEDQLLLLVLLPEHGGHLLLQVADDVRVDLWEESARLSLQHRRPGPHSQSFGFAWPGGGA